MHTCKTNLDGFLTEQCGLEKIRAELFKVQKQTLFIQDCEVSAWVEEDCSVTCGGGRQILTRTITVQPSNGGAACGPLQAEQSCNERVCPVDCEMEDWSEWSSCSADCGGGVKSKVRSITSAAEHGGEPCGESSMTESCNVHSCDKNCELGDWSKWTACSQACDAGTKIRRKNIISAVQGNGHCPSVDASERMEEKICNTAPCVPSGSTKILSCQAKLDVMLLIDGSGSVGQDGWTASVQAATQIAKSLAGDVRAGTIVFSGPNTFPKLWQCLGVKQGTPNLKDDCGINLLSPFVSDANSVAGQISSASFPGGTTLTSLALITAETELSNGRSDAQSVVILITDGRPLSPQRTLRAAWRLRKKARLIVVPVGKLVPRRFMIRLASKPKRDNMIFSKTFTELNTPKKLNKIISHMCPTVSASL